MHQPNEANQKLTLQMYKQSFPFTGTDRPLGLQEVKAPRIPKHLANESGKFVSPMNQPPLPPRRYPWYSHTITSSVTVTTFA